MLPRAEIDAFVDTRETAHQFEATRDHRHMARVTLNVIQGGIQAAVNKYSSIPSPRLVAVEVDNAQMDVAAAIDHLAQHCHPQTQAVVLGTVNDVMLYRRLTAMGVSDYLVKPLGADDLVDSFGRVLGTQDRAGSRRLIAVLGSKGGVGTTSVAQALAWLTAAKLGEEALLMDFCGACGTSGIALGAEGRKSLEEMLADIDRVDADSLRRGGVMVRDRLLALPGGRGTLPPDLYSANAVDRMLEVAQQASANVIADLPTGWGTLARDVAANADRVLLVTTPVLGALRNTRMVLDELKNRRGVLADVHVVFNMAGVFGRCEVPILEAAKSLGVAAAAILPFAPAVFAGAELTGKPFVSDKATDGLLAQLEPLARIVLELDDPGVRAAVEGKKVSPIQRFTQLLGFK